MRLLLLGLSYCWAGPAEAVSCYRAAIAARPGGGDAAELLGAEERAHLRRQARQWLSAEIVAGARRVESSAGTRPSRANLLRLRDDPDDAALPDAAQWFEADSDEQSRWLEVWSDINRLLRRIDAPSKDHSAAR